MDVGNINYTGSSTRFRDNDLKVVIRIEFEIVVGKKFQIGKQLTVIVKALQSVSLVNSGNGNKRINCGRWELFIALLYRK